MGREAAISPPSAVASCLASSIFFCSLMPRPTETMISAWVRSTACLASLKSFGLVANHAVGDFDVHGFDRSGRAARFHFVSAKCAVLEGREPWGIAGEADIGGEFALEHLASEQQLAAFVLVSDGVADERAVQRRREFRGKVAHLVGVRHQHQLGLLLLDKAFQRGRETVRSVGLELRRLDGVHFADFLCRNFAGNAATPLPTTAASSAHPVWAAMACAPVRVSHETRFSLPSRCSTTTRIVSAI